MFPKSTIPKSCTKNVKEVECKNITAMNGAANRRKMRPAIARPKRGMRINDKIILDIKEIALE